MGSKTNLSSAPLNFHKVSAVIERAMNLWFRTFWVWITSFSKPRIGLLGESRLRGFVLPHDLDIYGHMNNGRYLTFMDLGRMDLILRSGIAKPAIQQGWQPIVAGSWVRYRKPLKLFESFELTTRVAGWTERWFVIEQQIIRKGRVCTQAFIQGVFVGSKGRVSCNKILDALGYEEPSPPLPHFIEDWLDTRLVSAATKKEPEIG